MRTFYIFKIKKAIYKVTRDNSYNLYKAFENIYNLNSKELSYYYEYFNELRDFFDKKQLDYNFYEIYKNNYTYTKVNNIHMINDYYTKEKSRLIIKKNYLCIKSTKSIPRFLKTLKNNQYIFVCDFKNQDYFWIEDLV